MQKRALITRIVAIVLAALMFLSVGAAAISAFAMGAEVPVTGQDVSNTKWIIVAVVVAVIAIVACVVLPKIKKK